LWENNKGWGVLTIFATGVFITRTSG